MAEERVQRRLAAILAADVAGYSRMMGRNEEGTLASLSAHRTEMIDPCIAEHRGRIVKTTGDGLLAEFASVVDAVRCAVTFQENMAARNADAQEDSRIEFRIGVNLGDVIVQDNDVFGDGVNVAARLEALAEPRGIFVSGDVFRQVDGKIEASFDDLGDQKLKNIERPTRVYRVQLGTEESVGHTESGPLPLPDKPSIAVLPFENMSGDAEQEFFADGITEDILTELSRFHELFVISRTSAFKYKGKAINIPEVARELGVQYVAEGSVRKAGDRVRVTIQLIDAETDRHIWAERYDRKLEDIFAIQDEISQAIVATLPGRVEAARRERAAHKPTDNMAAYELVLGGKLLHHRSMRDSNREALDMIERAIAIDPKYAHAHAWKACISAQAWGYGWVEDVEAAWGVVVSELETALALDDGDSDVHRILAAVNITYHDFDKANFHQGRALTLNPNDDLIVVQKGELLTWLGQPEEGIEWIKKAMRLNPYHPERFWNHLGRAHFVARQYREAITAFQSISAFDHSHRAFLAAANMQMGDEGAATAHADQVLALQPDFSIASYLETMHYAHDAERDHHREALLKAGLPE
ncbi:MAG: adenylate/guanylate cyclase domain-containing protein [Alphaproteobacteria bacterium]